MGLFHMTDNTTPAALHAFHKQQAYLKYSNLQIYIKNTKVTAVSPVDAKPNV